MRRKAQGGWLLTVGSLVLLVVALTATMSPGVTLCINPGPGYVGPLVFSLCRVSPTIMALNLAGTSLMLVDACTSRRRLPVTVFVAASGIAVFSYTVLWTLVYGGVVDDMAFRWSIFLRSLADDGEVTMYVWDGFFRLTVPLCLLDIFIGLRSAARPFRRLTDRAYDVLVMQD